MTVSSKILEAIERNNVFFSFEYFVPVTESGKRNLMNRIDRMAGMGPVFIDITFHPKTRAKTLEIASDAVKYCGVDVVMHLTCKYMSAEKLKATLNKMKAAGLTTILALRGDATDDGQEQTVGDSPSPGGRLDPNKINRLDSYNRSDSPQHADELMKLIQEEHPGYFDIVVAGYPEGWSGAGCGSEAYFEDIQTLKRKVDLGAKFVMTQFFYDSSFFIQYVTDCRAAGITVPIIPGIMPIQNYRDFIRMTEHVKCKVPDHVMEKLIPIKNDDAAVKAFGVEYAITMCKELLQGGAKGLHFYTLNLERSVEKIVAGLQDEIGKGHRQLPWRPSAHAKREGEDVRPIFWANRPWSYLDRTQAWDDFPNGRWGDSSSPAFGGLPDVHFGSRNPGLDVDRKVEWGENPLSAEEVYKVFADYIDEKVTCLPWCDRGLELETGPMKEMLSRINLAGFLTINSQPRVNGVSSSDAAFGWGPPNGYVYQKAYIEFFCSPQHLAALEEAIQEDPKKYGSLVYQAINVDGRYRGNTVANTPYVCAVTWGVFPGREILQPTIVDSESFKVWKEEAFSLWLTDWAAIYNEDSVAFEVIYELHDTLYLVNIVDNDFVHGDVFQVFERAIEILKQQDADINCP